MSSSFRSRSSISKQRGAEMSSRLIPPNAGAIIFTVSTILPGSFVSSGIGKASTPASSLKSMALPSMTGMAASGPMSPSPRTAVPSVTTATAFCLMVSVKARLGSSLIARQTRATPGVYAMLRSSRVRIGTLLWISILPPRCMRKVRSEMFAIRTPAVLLTRSMMSWACRLSRALIVMSRSTRSPLISTRSTAPMSPPALPMTEVTRPSMPGLFRISRRTVKL